MARDQRLSRRQLLTVTGVAVSTAFVAGCGGGPGNGGYGGNGGDGGNEPAGNETGGNQTGENETTGNETAGNETGGTGGDTTGLEIAPGHDIRFSGQTTHWEGLRPSAIEGERNPTLVLEAGRTYSIGWTDGDGAAHNLQLRNANGDVVDDYTTGDPVAEPRNEVFEFTASDDIARYRCLPHPQMEGAIRIRGGNGNETAGNESDGNRTGGNGAGGNLTG